MVDRVADRHLRKLVMIVACALCLALVQFSAAAVADTRVSDEALALSRARALIDAWRGEGDALLAAKAELDRILKANPGSAPAHREYARYHIRNSHIHGRRFKEGGLALAERSLDSAVALAPAYAEAFVLRGHLYRLMNRKGEAYAALQQARKIGTDDLWLELNWSALLKDDGKYPEALGLCQAVIARAPANPSVLVGAHECIIAAYTALGQDEEADAAHRARIAFEPGEAWPHGNYASFLLCVRDQPEAAMQEARTALGLMDYGMARGVLVAAGYRHWAAQVLSGRTVQAATAWNAANALSATNPVQLVSDVCGPTAAHAILRALRDTKRSAVIVPMHAVMLAAEAADTPADGVAGIFALEVVATGRQRDVIFLNSQTDYRDQRNLTIRFSAAGVADFRKRHGADPDVALKGKQITVIGTVRRERIDFLTQGKPTGKFYYQTHVVVTEAEQVAIFDPSAAPPTELPAGIEA